MDRSELLDLLEQLTTGEYTAFVVEAYEGDRAGDMHVAYADSNAIRCLKVIVDLSTHEPSRGYLLRGMPSRRDIVFVPAGVDHG